MTRLELTRSNPISGQEDNQKGAIIWKESNPGVKLLHLPVTMGPNSPGMTGIFGDAINWWRQIGLPATEYIGFDETCISNQEEYLNLKKWPSKRGLNFEPPALLASIDDE